MTIKKETRKYVSWKAHQEDVMYVTYDIVFNDQGKLENVFNQLGYSIEKNGECWEYFRNKYKS